MNVLPLRPVYRRRHWLLGVAILAVWSVSFAAFAEVGKEQEIDLLLKELDEEFKWLQAESNADVVWSASKYQQSASHAPALVSIITSDDIQMFGYRTLAEIIESVSGMYASYNRNYAYIGVRGFQRSGDLNTRILLLIDGHRINDTIFQQAFVGTDFPVDVDLIDRVEITRGPGSCLYGTNAFFAVINVIPKTGSHVNGAEVSADAGTFHSAKARLTSGQTINAETEMLVSATMFRSEGEERLYYSAFDDPSTNNGIAEKKDGDSTAQFFLNASAQKFKLSGLYGSRKKDVPTAPYDTTFNEDFTTTDNRGYLEASYQREFRDDFNLFASLYYDRYQYEASYPYLNEEAPNGVGKNRDDDLAEWLGSEIRVIFDGLRHTRLTSGIEYQYNLNQNILNYDETPYIVRLDERNEDSTWAAYFQGEVQPVFPLILNAGIRYDWYETFGETINPRVALIYTPFFPTTLKGIYGSAFRAPNIFENYNTGAAGSATLDPETIDTYEIIWEQRLNDSVKTVASGFYYTIDGLISQVEYGDDSWTYANSDDIVAKGVEFEMQGRWRKRLTGTMNYTYQDTEDKNTGERISNSPQHLVNVRFAFPLFMDTMTGAVEAHYMSDRLTPRQHTAGEHATVNLTWTWTLRGATLSASVYNLFDVKYSDPVGEEFAQDAIEQPGRTARIKIAYLF